MLHSCVGLILAPCLCKSAKAKARRSTTFKAPRLPSQTFEPEETHHEKPPFTLGSCLHLRHCTGNGPVEPAFPGTPGVLLHHHAPNGARCRCPTCQCFMAGDADVGRLVIPCPCPTCTLQVSLAVRFVLSAFLLRVHAASKNAVRQQSAEGRKGPQSAAMVGGGGCSRATIHHRF